MVDRPVLIAAASRPYPTEVLNGDAWHVDWRPNGCRLAVIDGLGHGPDAAAAAAAARAVLVAWPDADPVEALRRCHEALRATRGAAMGVVAVDLSADRLTFAGVGNVDGRVVMGERSLRLPSSRGIVGALLPTVRPTDVSLEPGWLLVLHSDGVSARFDVAEVADAVASGPQDVADALLARWGRATDDATVVVASPASTVAPPERTVESRT